MLLQPFLGAMIVLRQWNWAVIPALAAVVLVFLVREPLIVLARQQWIWRGEHPETALARRYLWIELVCLAMAGTFLLVVWPLPVIAILGGGAAILTAIAVYMTVKNRQRSLWLQAWSAAGLSASGLAACFAVTDTIPVWAWWFWGLHAAYFLATILVVHARLEARVSARKTARKSEGAATGAFLMLRRQAAVVSAVVLIASLTLAIQHPFYAAALLLSEVSHLYDLFTMRTPAALALPMMSVGKRALAISIAFTLLVVAGSIEY
jgi:hypothetical protein